MHFIYHDGTVKDAQTLDQMYMKKPQKQLVRIAFDPGEIISIDNQTNEMVTSGWSPKNSRYWDVSKSSLVWSGAISYIPWTWEILKIFFDNYNIIPKWIVGNHTVHEYDYNSYRWKAGLITTVRFKIWN